MYNDLDQIIDNIYLGNLLAAKDIETLKSKGIKKILSIMDEETPKYESSDFIHKKVNVEDYNGQNIIQYFGECLNFMKGEEKILVHCMAGASRSATIVIAYLMWTKKMNDTDAIKFIQKKRSAVNPNKGFRDQLKILENYCIAKIIILIKLIFKGLNGNLQKTYYLTFKSHWKQMIKICK